MQRLNGCNLLMRTLLLVWIIIGLLVACSQSAPIPKGDYQQTDALIQMVSNNIAKAPSLDEVLDIDHSRLANREGSRLAPTRVMLFHNMALEVQLLQLNPRWQWNCLFESWGTDHIIQRHEL